MNMKRARFWRNLLLFSALSGAASLPQTHAQEGASRVGNGAAGPGAAGVPTSEGFAPLSPSPYMPLDAGYNFQRPMPPALPQLQDTLRNSRRDSVGPRFDIGQFLGDRLGVADNDTNFNFLLPYLMGSENDVLFIDGRGVVTQLGQGAASAGLGFRSYDPNINRLYGISGWVDYDQGHQRTYQQAGVSFESLGNWIDFRANGYIPFGTESNLISNANVGSPFFQGSSLLINQRQVTESAYRGFDAEIGGPLPLLGRYGVSGYVGGYWLDAKTDEVAAGPRVRLEANVTDGARVSLTASDDPVFGTNAWVNLNLTLPDGRARRWFRPTEVQDRMFRTVERSYRVQTHTRADLVPTPVLVGSGGTPNNPQGSFTGQPVRVIFVDPDRVANGDGTLENPFNTFQGFANVAANTLIIVDGSPNNRPVTGNLSLFGDQKLLSTSILAAGGVQLDTNLGVITLPSISGFGDAISVSPILQNPAGGTLLTLGGNNIEVAGITFDGTTGNIAIPNATGIAGSNFSDFNIHHNTFRDYSNAVVMSNVRGVGLFQANTLTGTPGVSVDGFRLTNSGVGSLDLFINSFEPPVTGPGSGLLASANTFTGNDNAGINITARNRAVINAHIVDNTISNNGQGVILNAAATRSVINASIVNNLIDGNRGEDRNLNGILDPGEDLNGDGVLNAGNGVLLMANASTLNLAQLGEDLNSNGVLDPTEDSNGNGRLDLSEDTNANGVLDVSEDANGNGLLDTGEDTNANGQLDTTTEDKNGNGQLDQSEDLDGDSVLDGSEDSNGNGILDGGYLFASNTITRNTGDGLAVQSLNNSIVNMFVVANNFGSPADHSTGNRGRGLSITADSGTVNANIGFLPNEDINFNGVLDAGEDTNGNGTLDGGDPLDANNFVANRTGGLFVDLSGTAVGNIVAINNTITGVGSGDLAFQIIGANNGTGAGTPFSFVNSSQQGNNVTGLDWNLAGAALEFNTTGVNSNLFTPANGTEVATGLTTVNGTSNPLQVTDQATALNLQFSSFQSLNGVLDVGEDTNANGVLDSGEDLPAQFDFGIGTSGAGGAPANLSGNNFIGSQVTATFSSGQVLAGTMQAVAGSLTDSEFVASGSGNNSGSGPGIELRASQAAVFTNPTFVSNNIQFNGGAGFVVSATEDGQINGLVLRGNTIQNNGAGTGNEDLNGNNRLDPSEDVNRNGVLDLGAGGIRLNTFAANSAQISGSILNNTMSNNSGPGISVTADSGAINLTQIDTNTLDGNSTSVVLNTLNNGTIATRVTNNTMNNSLNDGFVANADTGVITLNEFSGNTLNDAGGNGILLSALNGGTIDIPATEDINGNGTLDAGEDVNGNGFLDQGMRNNLLNNSVGNGLFVTGTSGIFNLGTVSGLSVNRVLAGKGGIVIDVTDSVMTGAFIGNSLIGNPVNNPTGGAGFSLTATNGTFDVSIGGPNATDRNTIQSNRGAGIAIVAQNTAVGSFRIENNLITGTQDDNLVATPFSGQGIFVGSRSFGTLTPATAILSNSSIVNNVVGDTTNTTLGNAGGGLLVQVGERTTLDGLNIDSNTFSSNGPTGAFVFNDANVINGITFLRTDDAIIDNVMISNNNIQNNTADGIYLHALGGFQDQLDFTIRANLIGDNTFNGINLRTEADAPLNTTITNNLIENNGTNGIQLTAFEVAANGADQEIQTGIWAGNTIRNNQQHGIQISAVTGNGAIQPLIIGQNGTDPATGLSLGNLITGNFLDGIEINAAGDIEINNNMISLNGRNAAGVASTEADGVAGVDLNIPSGVGELRLRMTNNTIQSNAGDGLEAFSRANFGFFTAVTVTALGNTFDGNTGRGIDLLNAGDAYLNFKLGDNTLAGGNVVSNNGLEGIYVVNTPATAQLQNNAFDPFEISTGSNPLDIAANMILDVQGNRVTGNNNAVLSITPPGTLIPPGAGLVLWVGTENASTRFFGADDTGDLFGSGTGDSNGNGVGSNSGDNMFAGNGRVNARVNNNMFQGNLGDDVFFQSFTATPVLPTTAGTWDATTFVVNQPFRQDPLARLNLVFTGNTGNSLNVTNVGAFYNDADAVFKSRERAGNGGQTPGGPFPINGGDTRRRNAQRIAFRGTDLFNTLNPITGPDVNFFTGLGIFEYAGMGASTFRIESDFDDTGFAQGDIFSTDSNTGDPVFDANGFVRPNSIFGEQPYGWGEVAPGTFSFDALNTLFP